MDVLAPTTMKNAAKCDTSCELQNPVSHQNFERNLRFSLRSMSVGVSVHPHHLLLLRAKEGRSRRRPSFDGLQPQMKTTLRRLVCYHTALSSFLVLTCAHIP